MLSFLVALISSVADSSKIRRHTYIHSSLVGSQQSPSPHPPTCQCFAFHLMMSLPTQNRLHTLSQPNLSSKPVCVQRSPPVTALHKIGLRTLPRHALTLNANHSHHAWTSVMEPSHWSKHGSFEVNQSLPVVGQKPRHHHRSFNGWGLDRSLGARDTPPAQAMLTFNEQGDILTFNNIGKDVFHESGIDVRRANFFRDILMEPSDSLIGQLKAFIQGGSQTIPVELIMGSTRRSGQIAMPQGNERNLLLSLNPSTSFQGRALLDSNFLILDMDQGARFMWNLTPEQRNQTWALKDLLDCNRPYAHEEIPIEFETSLQSPEGIPFPVRISISHFGAQFVPSEEPSFLLEMTAFPEDVGMLIVDRDLVVQYSDPVVSVDMFGLQECEIVGQHLSELLSVSDLDELKFHGEPISKIAQPLQSIEWGLESLHLDTSPSENGKEKPAQVYESPKSVARLSSRRNMEDGALTSDVLTSTPAKPIRSKVDRLHISSSKDTMCSKVTGKRWDGEIFDLVVTWKGAQVQEQSAQGTVILWLSRDYTNLRESINNSHLALVREQNESMVRGESQHTNLSLGEIIKSTAEHGLHDCQPKHQYEYPECEDIFTAGDYKVHYKPLKMIGEGGFGFVTRSYRLSDKKLNVSKFIKKGRLSEDCLVPSPSGSQIPIEVNFLIDLQHANVVRLLDHFENESYHQIVMEQHGFGMDLFEFLDRTPLMSEPLASYIFRQIVEAVGYLHSKNILHRDIKDENVIIDENFHAKLIDFGSATKFEFGEQFDTFSGTIEYCCPEILQGNLYDGPEAEIWALGILLYIILFVEAPFQNVEEIINFEPMIVGRYLEIGQLCERLLLQMLKKNPKKRPSLQYIQDHPWTLQPFDVSAHNFRDVVDCSPEEYEPKHHYEDY
ncbi:PAS domain-containing serine/threonine-protein kinase-like [Tigriopus californicus]|uniref:PAS domain-containing serine/threonine-protein kinase-like n=1 Tax=Tigriopus californicus TaxID=6832 RepID=UPI0027DA1F5F|nr:PAS domain-containing serine/threonine-protein kinase-like [Tigriopus californicus]